MVLFRGAVLNDGFSLETFYMIAPPAITMASVIATLSADALEELRNRSMGVEVSI